jgi:polyhydroxyalkanoate synthesis regulator phasin
MQEAWRAYLELALGATEASRKRATKAVRKLVGKGGATAEQLQALASELLATSTANREAVAKLVRYEVDRALGRVGLATADEVATLTARVRDLERQQSAGARTGRTATRAATGETTPGEAGPATATAATATTGRAVAKKIVAKKAVAKKTVAKKAAKRAVATKAATGPRAAAGA